MFKTRLTELFGIEYPIISGGMMWLSKAELSSAVSDAGGLGVMTALSHPSPQNSCLSYYYFRLSAGL